MSYALVIYNNDEINMFDIIPKSLDPVILTRTRTAHCAKRKELKIAAGN